MVLAVAEGGAADIGAAGGGVDDDVVGGDTARKEAGVVENTGNDGCVGFGSIKYEGRPDCKKVTNLKGKVSCREEEFELEKTLAKAILRKELNQPKQRHHRLSEAHNAIQQLWAVWGYDQTSCSR